MNETTILLLCLAAIVISIAICFKTGINMGLIAMTFAFLIGCLFMGEKAASIFGFWPDSLISWHPPCSMALQERTGR